MMKEQCLPGKVVECQEGSCLGGGGVTDVEWDNR